MIPSIRKLLVRRAVMVVVVLLAVGILLTSLSGGWKGAFDQLGWALVLSVGIAAFGVWSSARAVKKSFVDGATPDFALVPVDRAQWPKTDWNTFEDYAAQLEARGWRRLGDFAPARQAKGVRLMARFLGDAAGTRLVEIQHLERLAPTPLMGDEHFTTRITLSSILGGRVHVQVSDRPAHPALYLSRGERTVAASYPGKGLFELIDIHERLCAFVAARVAKPVDAGLDLARYAVLARENQAEAKARLGTAHAWQLVREYDAFAANPLSKWSPDVEFLRSLAPRSWDEIDAARAAPVAAPAVTPEVRALRERIASGAHWFYWIAALSLVNAVTAALGSTWGFVIGLGASQVVSAIAQAADGEAGPFIAAVSWVVNLGLIGLFVLFGWLAQRPSLAAFAIGMAIFALDALIFVLVGDWVGVAFHALALYFLGKGYGAAREMRRVAAAPLPQDAMAEVKA